MKVSKITILENILGVVLAGFIVFKVFPERDLCRQMNQPVYVILLLVFTVLLFMSLNPIVGFLFLLYAYQMLQYGRDTKRNEQLKKLNPEQDPALEEIVIQNSSFARIKNKDEDQDTMVKPILEKIKI